MAIDLMERIAQAEAAAEEVRARAGAEAREILKSVEEASLAANRELQKELREENACQLAAARESATAEIQRAGAGEEARRAQQRAQAQARLDQAAARIYERVTTWQS